jgi:hypothetical protein
VTVETYPQFLPTDTTDDTAPLATSAREIQNSFRTKKKPNLSPRIRRHDGWRMALSWRLHVNLSDSLALSAHAPDPNTARHPGPRVT